MAIKVRVRKSDKVKRMVYKFLTLGSDIGRRLNRPAWTGTEVTGGMTAHNHLHTSDFRKNFFK